MPTMTPNDRINKLLQTLTAPGQPQYIYRGENRSDYPDVSSNLYREYRNSTTIQYLGIQDIEGLELEAAARHTADRHDTAALRSLVQHYHGKTNAIDFTRDLNIALFFACDGNFDQPGRIIRLDENSTSCELEEPPEPWHRVIVQKSVFVIPQEGFVPPDEYAGITIPADLKVPLLTHLRIYHGISQTQVYNDLHGFVNYRANHKETLEINFAAMDQDNAGHHQQALALLDKSIDRDPDASITHYLKGLILRGLDLIDAAIASCDRAIALNPGLPDAYNDRGLCHQINGDNVRAFQDYSTAIRIAPGYSWAYNNRGLLRYENGDTRGAMRDYNRALHYEPTSRLALNNRGLLHLANGDTTAAIADLDAVIALHPEWGTPYLNRAYAHQAAGHYAPAAADFQRAIRIDPALEAYAASGEPFTELHS